MRATAILMSPLFWSDALVGGSRGFYDQFYKLFNILHPRAKFCSNIGGGYNAYLKDAPSRERIEVSMKTAPMSVLPRAKKAFLSLSMFSWTAREAARLYCHQTPKQLAKGVVEILIPAMSNFLGSLYGCCENLANP